MVHFQEYSSRQEPLDMDVSENSGTPKSSMLIRFFIINHPFWGSPIFGKHPYLESVSVSTRPAKQKIDPFWTNVGTFRFGRSTEHHAWGTADCRLSCLWIVCRILGCWLKHEAVNRRPEDGFFSRQRVMFLFQQI